VIDALDESGGVLMKKVVVVGCGAYIDGGYGCPAEWLCLKAAALGEGNFEEPVQVLGFSRCECPGRTIAANLGVAIKMSGIKPDLIYFSTCLSKAKPVCPYGTPEQFASIVEEKPE